MTEAKIYQPSKTTMQSGRAKNKWVLEYEQVGKRAPEPLMGWIAAPDTRNQVRLQFATQEEAIAYAEKHKLRYSLGKPVTRKLKGRTYLDNFKYELVK